MSDHIPDAGKMPADGFYNALVQLDTGGEMNFAVRVYEGRVYTPHQYEFRLDACSDFTPLSTWLFVSHWPQYAVDQLEALRTANAALVERVARLQDECRIAILRAERAEERVKRIEAAANKLAERHLLVPTTYPHAQAHVAEYNKAKGGE